MYRRAFLTILFWFLSSCHFLTAKDIGLLIVATGKYITFVKPLITSAEKHFCKNHHVTYFVFTDGYFPTADNVVCFYQERLGWPFDTMMRYHAYAAHSDELAKQDYLFACDADMRFVDTVGDEILDDRVATLHPCYVGCRGTYETNPISTACVHSHEGTHYFAGGFYGGSSKAFLQILETNIARVDQDRQKGYVALWHDESHWNRYCIDYPPTTLLSPAYCFPEGWDLPFRQKIISLSKNQTSIRSL